MSTAGRIVVVQALLGMVCSALFFTVSTPSGTSALLAVLSSGLPCAYYAWVQARIFNATRLLMHGVFKTLLTMTLMGVCIVKAGIEPMAFFITFIVMQLSYFSGTASAK